MKIFFEKIILFVVLSYLIILLPGIITFYNLPVNFEENGLATIIDKHSRLSKAQKSKIIIVGGSGCGMGINSALIDSAFNYHYEVVNMGLFGQLGLCYMTDEIKEDIIKEDIILIIPEYQHFYYHFYGDRGLLRMLRIYKRSIKYLSSYKQVLIIAKFFAPYLLDELFNNTENNSNISPVWNRKYVNKYGDFCGYLQVKDTVDVKGL